MDYYYTNLVIIPNQHAFYLTKNPCPYDFNSKTSQEENKIQELILENHVILTKQILLNNLYFKIFYQEYQINH